MNKMKRYAGEDESLVGGAEDERPAPTGMGEIAESRADKMMGEDVIDEETGAKSKYKRNPETGQLYSEEPEMTKPKPKKKKTPSSSSSFSEKARKAGFTSAETKGGAALMYRNPMGKKMASGGTASSRADGIAQRGKTRGKMC